MHSIYLLAEATIQNQRQEDCRLIVQLETENGGMTKDLQKAAEVAMKQKFRSNLPLVPVSEGAAKRYLQSDPSPERGSINLTASTPIFWHLVRI
jgi:hypothetical protein